MLHASANEELRLPPILETATYLPAVGLLGMTRNAQLLTNNWTIDLLDKHIRRATDGIGLSVSPNAKHIVAVHGNTVFRGTADDIGGLHQIPRDPEVGGTVKNVAICDNGEVVVLEVIAREREETLSIKHPDQVIVTPPRIGYMGQGSVGSSYVVPGYTEKTPIKNDIAMYSIHRYPIEGHQEGSAPPEYIIGDVDKTNAPSKIVVTPEGDAVAVAYDLVTQRVNIHVVRADGTSKVIDANLKYVTLSPAMAMHPDGRGFAFYYTDAKTGESGVCLADLKSNQIRAIPIPKVKQNGEEEGRLRTCLAWLDDRTIILGGNGSAVRIVDLVGSTTMSIDASDPARGHTNDVEVCYISPPTDGIVHIVRKQGAVYSLKYPAYVK